MIKKIKLRKVISSILIVSLILVNVSILVFATSNPWDKYNNYIPNDTPVAKRHLRGTWITTVVNLDWPSTKAVDLLKDSERIQKSKDELIEIFDRAVQLNMNAVFFQVSPSADAFYKSNIVPWSRYLTGKLGKDPGFDPLAFAIEEAHKRNLEIHAWFNPYRVSMNTKEETKSSLNINKSVYKEHPDWIRTSMDRFVVDPGIPEVRKWATDRVMEVVNKYDVDGVHFDDYFYYEKTEGEMGDDETFKKYNAGKFKNKGDWRRNNTYLLIKEVSKRVSEVKPWVKFGVSPAGIWGNKKDGHVDGSDTNSSFTNYEKAFADTKKWVEEEILDYIAPQIYFSFGNERAPYGEIASWWANVCKGKNVHLYIGNALYKVNEDSDAYFKGAEGTREIERQLKYNVSNPQILGTALFRMKNFTDSNKLDAVNNIKNSIWNTKSLVPSMSWKKVSKPITPSQGKLEEMSNGIKVTWNNTDANATYYAIYRFNKTDKIDITVDNSVKNLIGTVRKNGGAIQQFIDLEKKSAENIVYVVTALNRNHEESQGLKISKSYSKYFPDVLENFSWASKEIDVLYDRGVIKGDDKGLFNPMNNTKRADFVVMIVRALKLIQSFTSNFMDVSSKDYYYNEVGIAKKLGIIKGNNNNYFIPNGIITREDMMVIIERSLRLTGNEPGKADYSVLEAYEDADKISSYAKQSVANLVKAGMVKGSAGRLNPKTPTTRAEVVVMLARVLEK